MNIKAMDPRVEAIANNWSEDRIGFVRLVAMKHRTMESEFHVVDRALDLSGGFAMFKKERPRAAVPRLVRARSGRRSRR